VTLLLAHYNEALSNSPPTQTLANPQESLQTASDLLSDLQVETYSSMERREKTEFLLEQMRLLVGVAKNKDAEAQRAKESREVGQENKGAGLVDGEAEWVKVRVGGRKVNEAFLKEEANEVRCCSWFPSYIHL
jgi:26S proteasome regulatory subunit N5